MSQERILPPQSLLGGAGAHAKAALSKVIPAEGEPRSWTVAELGRRPRGFFSEIRRRKSLDQRVLACGPGDSSESPRSPMWATALIRSALPSPHGRPQAAGSAPRSIRRHPPSSPYVARCSVWRACRCHALSLRFGSPPPTSSCPVRESVAGERSEGVDSAKMADPPQVFHPVTFLGGVLLRSD